jgi:peptidoglycan-N-acetylglucosamine deacetylase
MIAEIVGGIGVAGLATWAGLESMWPTLHAYGRSFIGLEPGSRKLALTYDDGPNDPCTPRLIEVLARHNVKATFFVLGRFVQQKPEIVRALASARHEIGNHSWDHPRLIFASNGELRRQVEQTQSAIFDACGVTPTLFRPPYGGRRPGTLSAVRALGLEPVLWNVTCYDWKPTPPEKVVAHAQRQIRGGDVILLHDGDQRAMGAERSRTVEATDRLVARYQAQGFEFVTIPEMMAAKA